LNVLPVVVAHCLLTSVIISCTKPSIFMLPDTQLPIRNIPDYALNRKGVKKVMVIRGTNANEDVRVVMFMGKTSTDHG